MARETEATDELPAISKIEYPTTVGEDQYDAVVIWFENDTALRYVWNSHARQIQEQTYVNGVVHSSYNVGGSEEELTDYALTSVAEYTNELREDPEACEFVGGHIYEMLVQ